MAARRAGSRDTQRPGKPQASKSRTDAVNESPGCLVTKDSLKQMSLPCLVNCRQT
jgi:hypothetical protein